LATTIKKSEEIRGILAKACERREMLVLASPFLRFESQFIALEEKELHVLATMSREDATYGLRGPDLMMRFPDGLGFFEAPIETLGIGLMNGRHTVRLAIPKSLRENDQRVAYRVERVGRVNATFSTPKNAIHIAALADISTTGARLHTQRDLQPDELSAGDRILVDLPLSPEIQIQTSAVVRHALTRRIGVEFRPPLPPQIAEPLSKWVFLRREEERERAAQRLEQNRPVAIPNSSLPPLGILLCTQDADLDAALQASLEGLPSITRLGPNAQELKAALGSHPVLAIFHLSSANLDERRRMKLLVEMAQRKCPTLLLGTNVDGAALFELAHEWKASSALVWHPDRSLFLHRLAQGIIRRHGQGGDSPMAPAEPGSLE